MAKRNWRSDEFGRWSESLRNTTFDIDSFKLIKEADIDHIKDGMVYLKGDGIEVPKKNKPVSMEHGGLKKPKYEPDPRFMQGLTSAQIDVYLANLNKANQMADEEDLIPPMFEPDEDAKRGNFLPPAVVPSKPFAPDKWLDGYDPGDPRGDMTVEGAIEVAKGIKGELQTGDGWELIVNDDFGGRPHVFNVDQWEVAKGDEMWSIECDSQSGPPPEHFHDFFAACFRQNPEIENECQYPRKQEFIEVLLNSPDFNVLHESTQFNSLASQMATVELARRYDDLHNRDLELQAQREANPKLPKHEMQDHIACIAAAGKAIRDAQIQIDFLLEMIKSFGYGDGEPGQVQLDQIKEGLQQVLSNPQLKRILELAGRYRLTAQSAQKTKVKHGYDDIIGVKLDGDVGKILPLEMIKLADPDFELDAMRRLVERQMMCRDYEGCEPQARGPIIVCVDESGSMRGEPIANAKALALAMFWIAKKQKRQCMLVSFSSGPAYYYCGIDPDRTRDRGNGITQWLEHFFNGGTDLQVPCVEMPKMWDTYTDIDKGKTDMVIITDAALRIDDNMRTKFLAWKKREDVRVQTIVIGAEGQSMKEISDILHYVRSLSVGEDCVLDAFSI